MWNFLPAVALAALTALPAAAQEIPPIAFVDVSVALDAPDADALDHWPRIARDLSDAILAVADPFLATDGHIVEVVISEISLAGVTTLPPTGEFSRLEGRVAIREAPGAPPVRQESIALDATGFLPAQGTDAHIIAGRPEYYNALVNVFAVRTLEEVQALR